MDDIRSHIFRIIEKYHMIAPGIRVIAGVSGGADSVCLLDVLEHYRREIPFELLIVHVEHGLRGTESLADAVFVETLCEKMQLPCRVAHADVRGRMSREGLSCEEAGRAERYRIFQEVCREWGAQRIAVAHNENDQAETVLWNLARGSGLSGLGGIRPVQGDIIRPLLFTRREEIEAYLRGEGLSWRTDATNLETDFTRNRIRLSVLPLMEQELNAQAGRHIAEASGRLREAQEYIDRMTDAAARRCIFVREDCGDDPLAVADGAGVDAGKTLPLSPVCIRLAPFKKEESLIQKELLKRALEMCAQTAQAEASNHSDLKAGGSSGMKDIGAVHLEMLARLADMDCGKSCDLPNGIRAVREDGLLRVEQSTLHGEPRAAGKTDLSSNDAWKLHTEAGLLPYDVHLPVPGAVICGGIRVSAELVANAPELKNYFLEEKKYTKWISYDTIKGNLRLRIRRTGDYLVVNAQGGRKKLKDYFIDQKIPRAMRDRILLLADGPHILWVIGYRIGEDVKVTENTGQVLRVECEGGTRH
ncbi:MAG: tRNA lysidine(34) synthetase TilS [Lachnospiraceae bacterium]|nr:tRNA lysidine(34) synthetase TilS [Lachnospiraceae bacterium]